MVTDDSVMRMVIQFETSLRLWEVLWHHCVVRQRVSFSSLQKVEARYNRNVQLMIFTDCLVLLLILSNWGHSDFWPDPGDVVHFDVIFSLIQKLRGWSKKVILIKVKVMLVVFSTK